ncbi:hypothetical protein ACXGQW_04900 [Wenyingzhuangia sp. IMCC45533]
MKIFIKKIESGALQLVVFVAIILFLLMSSLILLDYFNKKNQLVFLFDKEVQVKNIESFKNLNHSKTSEELYLLGKRGSVEKEYFNYGSFRILNTSTVLANSRIRNYAFMGGKPSETSITLENHQFGLSISGTTRIEGNLKLPKEGIKAGFVNGRYYYGNQLNYFGVVSPSKEKIAQPRNVTYLNDFITKDLRSYINELKPNLIYHNSFSLPTKVYRSSRSIHLKKLKISGNIVINSSEEIHVYETTNLEDVILMAPKIVIHQRTKGVFQAIATENILVERNVKMYYPSALVLKDINKTAKLEILENVNFMGIIMYLKNENKDFRSINIKISKGTTILGDIYCEGGLFITGATVDGSLKSKYLIHKTLGSTYINMLSDVRVSNKKGYQLFSGLSWEDNYKVMKWLY